MDKIKEINIEMLNKIIRSGKPKGLFYFIDNGGLVIGIDNEKGDCWTEEFSELENCKRWLNGENIEEVR